MPRRTQTARRAADPDSHHGFLDALEDKPRKKRSGERPPRDQDEADIDLDHIP